VPVVKQLTVMMENRPGALAELCTEMAKVAVNISAIHSGEGGPFVPVRLVVSHPEAAKRVCQALKLHYVEQDVVAVKVADRPGSLGKITRKLSEKGVNIEYVYGSIGRSATQAMIVLGVSDIHAAARVVK